jgi:hypothetical protein
VQRIPDDVADGARAHEPPGCGDIARRGQRRHHRRGAPQETSKALRLASLGGERDGGTHAARDALEWRARALGRRTSSSRMLRGRLNDRGVPLQPR